MIYGILEAPYNDKVGKLGKTLYKINIFEPRDWPRDDGWFTWHVHDKKEHNLNFLPLSSGASPTYDAALHEAKEVVERYHKERIREYEILLVREE